MKLPLSGNIVLFIFILVGILLVCFGIYLQTSNTAFLNVAHEATAVITDIDTYRDSDGDTRRSVAVEFKVDGQTYHGKLGEWHSGMAIGGRTKVYFNPDNPFDFRGGSVNFIGYLVIGFGSVFFIVGASPILSGILKKKKKHRLKESGQRVEARIDSVDINRSFSMNGRHPFVLRCSYVEPGSRKVFSFNSENIWFNVNAILQNTGIKTLPVYLDEKNSAKYHVDIDPLKEFLGN